MPDLAQLDIFAERFWAKVNKATASGCWEWTAATHRKGPRGYGLFFYMDRPQLAHRVVLKMQGVELGRWDFVCHRCDNRLCVNPDHLFVGTPKQNSEDMVAKGRQSFGEGRPTAKLTEASVGEIIDRLAGGAKRARLAEEYGVSVASIDHIARGTAWKHLSLALAS